MVPVTVDVKVPEVDEVSTPVTSTDPVPEECSKRPVPPVIVHEPVKWKVVAEVGQAMSFDELNSLSPFAAVKVSCSVAVNPPWHDAGPITVAKATNVVSPRCCRWPVPVIVAVVCDVIVKEPEKPPLKGVEWDANTTGNPASTITARTMGIRTSFFIPMQTPPS
jgi:hypothetical protein